MGILEAKELHVLLGRYSNGSISEPQHASLMREASERFYQKLVKEWKLHDPTIRADDEFFASMLSSASGTIVSRWMESDFAYPAEEVAEMSVRTFEKVADMMKGDVPRSFTETKNGTDSL